MRHLVCINRENGRILWKTNEKTTGRETNFAGFNALHGFATSTPVADASGVYVNFGTSGAVAYAHDGTELWQTALGNAVHDWGTSSSPVLFENLVIVHADIEGAALVALNKKTGREVWRVRTGGQDSWSTPLVAAVGDRHELIFHHSQGNPTATLAAVDPKDGSSLWQCKVLKNYLCPSPIHHNGVIYVLAYQRAAAIRPGGRGDVTSTHVEWTLNKGTEICTPIFHESHLYWAHQDSGIAFCVNASSGEVVYQQRLQPAPGKLYASGVLAGGRIYYVSRENGTYVVNAKQQFKQLSHNVIATDKSIFNGTPAVSHGELLLRSNQFLYCIGEK